MTEPEKRKRPKKAPVEPIDHPKRLRVLKQVQEDTPSRLKAFKRAYARDSLRSAVNANCLYCCGLSYIEVKHCTSIGCPMWEYRPYQDKEEVNET